MLNLTHQAINQRFEQEIPNLVKLAESQLNVKSPGNLASGKETPMPEVLAWASGQRVNEFVHPCVAAQGKDHSQ